MKKLQSLGKSLTKQQQKNIVGGLVDPGDGGGGGTCIRCYSYEGYTSCWYTNSGGYELCSRVYAHPSYYETVPCAGCTMN